MLSCFETFRARAANVLNANSFAIALTACDSMERTCSSLLGSAVIRRCLRRNGLFDDALVLYDDDDGAHAKYVTSHALSFRICTKLRWTERGRALHGELSVSR